MTTTTTIDDLDNAQRAAIPWPVLLFLGVLFIYPAVYFAQDGDYVLAGAFAVSGFMALSGLRVGAAAILGSVGAITAAIHYAPSIGCSQEARFTEWFGTTGLLNRGLCIGVVGLLIMIGFTSIATFVTRGLFRDRPILDKANRWSGFGLGLAEGIALCLFFLGGLFVIEPMQAAHAQPRSDDTTDQSLLSTAISTTTEQTRTSRLGPIVEQYNPFVHFPGLNKVEEVRKSVQVLSDPKKIERLLNDRSIQQMQQRTDIQAVVKKLTEDPEIQEMFRSGQPMDGSMVMTLLKHPAVLELLDQPGFTEEATKIILDTR